MKKTLLISAISLLCGVKSGIADSSLSHLSGTWVDPTFQGSSGFHFTEFSNGIYAYFLGYKSTVSGNAQWLLSPEPIPTPIIAGRSYVVEMQSGYIGNGASFTSGPTTVNGGREYWGTLSLTFNSCDSGTASLSGLDGNVVHNIIKLADLGELSCSESEVSTNNYCDYSVNEYNSSASVQAQSEATWSCDTTSRNLTGNGIPDHEVGTFPNAGNQNTITAMSISESFPLNPTASATTNNNLITIGYALNSVKIEPGTGGSCADTLDSCTLANDGTGAWRIEALGQSTFDFGTDMNNAHVQPTGQYHYHGMPEKLMEKLSPNNDKMVLVAWAMDGYPIYARYGYSTADDAASALKVLSGSYQLKSTADSGRISVAELPLGTFAQDYEYVAGSGDLDECNGRTGVTPDFPNGTYYYAITDSYPYAPRCLKGEVSTAQAGGTPPPRQ